MLNRYKGNPILEPIKKHSWESKRVFNCGAVYEAGKVHLIYRAQGGDGISRLGYASSKDGFTIDERLDQPIFSPEPGNEFEVLGIEDPRLTRIGENLYMCYTAWGKMHSRIAAQIGITSINFKDFLHHRWRWKQRWYPLVGVANKDCVLFPQKIKGKFVFYHRIEPHIWIAYSDNFKQWHNPKIIMQPEQKWETWKIGACAVPIKTKKGWILIYHGVDRRHYYRLGAALVDLKNPEKVISRSKKPVLEPKRPYEKEGHVPNVVFSCGAVVIKDTLFVYYGGADQVIGVATAKLSDIFSLLESH